MQRRIDLMAAEGVEFITNCNIGKDVSALDLHENCDAMVLALGSTWPRDLPIPGKIFFKHFFVFNSLTYHFNTTHKKHM